MFYPALTSKTFVAVGVRAVGVVQLGVRQSENRNESISATLIGRVLSMGLAKVETEDNRRWNTIWRLLFRSTTEDIGNSHNAKLLCVVFFCSSLRRVK